MSNFKMYGGAKTPFYPSPFDAHGCVYNVDIYLFIYLTTSGRPEPEYTLRRVMSSEPIHDEQLTKDC